MNPAGLTIEQVAALVEKAKGVSKRGDAVYAQLRLMLAEATTVKQIHQLAELETMIHSLIFEMCELVTNPTS